VSLLLDKPRDVCGSIVSDCSHRSN